MRVPRWLSLMVVLAMVMAACAAPGEQQTPGQQTPGQETPGGQTPGQETPGEQTPGQETPGEQTPGQETPGQETPGQETPGQETPGQETPGAGEPQTGGTLVFGGSRLAASLDPALTSDGESFRILQQIYEPLVDLAEGSVSEIVGVLAESWEGEPDGTTYTFNLRQDVQFHDGTPLNAEAVLANFERWNTFPDEMQGNAYYIGAVFGGFGEDSIVESVEATDEYTVTVNLRRPKADFIQGIALTPFSIISPAVLDEMGAADPVAGRFGTEVSQAGTGPFRWDSYTPDDNASLVRNEDYWDDPSEGPFLDRLIIQPIPNPSARLQALQAPGGVMGIDLVAPTEYEIVENDPNLNLVERFSYNTLYLAINPDATPDGPLADLQVRQAIAHAIDRQALIDPFYGGRASVANIFIPPSSESWHGVISENAPTFEYDPERARQLLEDAGYGEGNRPQVDFWFPTEVTRPYMPDPQGLAEATITMLEDVGFEVTSNNAIWGTEYIPSATQGQYDLHWLGWTGDYDDPWNWYGYHFDLRGGEPNPQFNCDPEGLRDAFTQANESYDEQSRGQAFGEVARIIHENVCFLTMIHGDTALAFQPEVQGYVAAPTGSESFKGVWIQQDQ
jgi:peptide/nickel transport system substrate-binding protein